MNDYTVFPVIFLLGRPAAGKSEIIDYLKQIPRDIRAEKFHIRDFVEIDDFPMLWAWFEEDAILAKHGYPRLHTDGDGYFKETFFWHLLIERLELEFWKQHKDCPDFGRSKTAIIEFSRGSQHGGYRDALAHFTSKILNRSSVLYVDVSFEESLRKNRKRFNPDKPHSILEHGLPDDKLQVLYGEVDWAELIAGPTGDPTDDPTGGPIDDPTDDPTGSSGYIRFGADPIPYAVFDNHDDVTTGDNPELGPRLIKTCAELWGKFSER